MFRYHSFIILFLTCLLLSCHEEKIETGQTLDISTLNLIKSLGLLEEGETIIQYYSNFEKDKAGSFFTSKRIAHYWLDRHKEKSDTTYAFYNDIISIDTVYEVPDTFSPYMRITKKDSSTFRAYVGGSKNEMKSFFEQAISNWKKKR